jgi:spermidine synthase
MDDNPQYLKTVEGIISSSFCFVIAVQNGEIIGMGRAICDGYSDAYIQDVTVESSYRGRGIGKGIIRCLIQFLRTNQFSGLDVLIGARL